MRIKVFLLSLSQQEQPEKLKAFLDTPMCSYAQQGDISKGLIAFSDCCPDP